MTPDEAIAIVKSKTNGRTRYEGQEPFLDEVLVGEIERLRNMLGKAGELVSNFFEATLLKDAAYVTKVAWEGYRLLQDPDFHPQYRPIVLDETDDAVSRAMKPAFEKKT